MLPMYRTCVICVSYRGAADTAACVRSLLRSTVPLVVVVVDSTPDDPALQEALAFAPETIILRAPANLGFGRSNNLGIAWALEQTACDYVFLLNNDTMVFPESIETLEKALDAQPEIEIVTPRIAYFDNPRILWYGGGVMDWKRASAFTPGFDQDAEAEMALLERNVTFASGCALFFRRKALEQLRGFDERFFMYEEDVELCLRASRARMVIRYIPSSLILHRAQGSSLGLNTDHVGFWSVKHPRLCFHAFHIVRNRLLVVHLHARGIQRVVVMLFFPAYVLRRAAGFVMGGRVDAVIAMMKGMIDFWRTVRSQRSKEAIVER